MSKPVRVIGWGNDGRRDDGVALVLIERLRQRRDLADYDIQFESHHQLGPEVVCSIMDASLVLFIDAHVADDRPPLFLERVHPHACGTLDSHHCSPSTLLALCASLGESAAPCFVMGIRATDCTYGDTLSRATAALLEDSERLVMEWLSGEVSDVSLA